jgi:hypothetical protein
MDSINKDKMDNKLFNLYTLAELSYQKHFKDMISNLDELYPVGWYENTNYKIKIEILLEAIKTNMLIVNIKNYQNIVEGVEPKIK